MSTDKRENLPIDKEEIQKRINKMMARFDLYDGHIYSKNKIIEKICLSVSGYTYRIYSFFRFTLLYWWQRHTRGFDDLDKWNAAWYIARKAIPVLTAWKEGFVGTSIKRHIEDRHGNIIELKDEEFNGNDAPEAFTEEEWKAIIEDIIFAFQFVLKEDVAVEYDREVYMQDYKRHKRGLKLLSIYFMSLWD